MSHMGCSCLFNMDTFCSDTGPIRYIGGTWNDEIIHTHSYTFIHEPLLSSDWEAHEMMRSFTPIHTHSYMNHSSQGIERHMKWWGHSHPFIHILTWAAPPILYLIVAKGEFTLITIESSYFNIFYTTINTDQKKMGQKMEKMDKTEYFSVMWDFLIFLTHLMLIDFT